VKEALNNVVKHAGASEVRIQIAPDDSGRLTISIRDNGKGFVKNSSTSQEPNISAGEQHYGLFNMRQRMENIFGGLDLESLPDGTCVKLTVLLVNTPLKRNPVSAG